MLEYISGRGTVGLIHNWPKNSLKIVEYRSGRGTVGLVFSWPKDYSWTGFQLAQRLVLKSWNTDLRGVQLDLSLVGPKISLKLLENRSGKGILQLAFSWPKD